MEHEKNDVSKATTNELRQKIMILNSELDKEKEKMFSISADMTNQYKQMQKQFLKEIRVLNENIKKQTDTIAKKDKEISELKNEHVSELSKKDGEIRELKRKAEEMANEFAKMLKNLLGKMNEKIEISQWQNNDIKNLVQG